MRFSLQRIQPYLFWGRNPAHASTQHHLAVATYLLIDSESRWNLRDLTRNVQGPITDGIFDLVFHFVPPYITLAPRRLRRVRFADGIGYRS